VDFKEASVKKSEELFGLVKSQPDGLLKEEAERRFKLQKNDAIKFQKISWLVILLRQFHSVFVYLLLVAAGISFFLGERTDALFITLFLIINACIGFFQEYKAETSIKLLQKFIQWKTRVKRNGQIIIINAEEIVEGDIVCLRAGDMIPADGYFLNSENITIDESSLTGETVPVEKISHPLDVEPADFFKAKNIGFFRTTMESGDGELLVFATGKNTAVGQIVTQIEEVHDQSGFEVGINRFSSFILKLTLITIGLMLLANIFIHNGEVNISTLLVFAIALTIGIIPEALPLVTTLTMSQGALRLARNNVVPRRLSAIEDLGSIEILCTDKTGTITENKMEVAEVYGEYEEVIFWSLVGSATYRDKSGSESENIFDRALEEKNSDDFEAKFNTKIKINDVPFDPVRKRESVLIQDGSFHVLIIRGAPEKILDGSKDPHREKMLLWVKEQGEKGRRVLAVAKKIFADGYDPKNLVSYEQQADIIGLVSFFDPLKDTARQALLDAEKLGVRVKIITGDSKEVAGWVGYGAGLIENPQFVLTGEELMRLSEEEQVKAVEDYDVFARTMPLDKQHIIGLLKRKYIVGFLGEGFNDAPALKLAHVALAVDGASDIAREASDIILLNKSLEVIVDGIREGRKIFANTIKYIKATLTSNFGNFYALAFASLLVSYLPMLPMQILLLNLLTDLPMVSIAIDSVDENDLKKPKGYNIKEIALVAIILGLVSTGFDFAFFGFFVNQGESVLQTMWFMGSVLTELVLLFSIRTSSFVLKVKSWPARSIIIITGIVASIAIWLPFTDFGQKTFSFKAPEPEHMIIVAILVFMYFVSTETVKTLYYRLVANKNGTNDNF